jgi:hypothetical protein
MRCQEWSIEGITKNMTFVQRPETIALRRKNVLIFWANAKIVRQKQAPHSQE